MKNSLKTIDIQAKEWFDRINGNSYFDCLVTFNFGLPSQRQFMCPFQYGYGNQYEHAATEVIKAIFRVMPGTLSDLRKAGIIIRTSKKENCKKRDLFNPTAKEMRGKKYYPFCEVDKGGYPL